MSLLALDNVTVSRGGTPLLEDVTFEVGPGDILWVRGANGSGKSTLLRAIAGFLSPTSGTISQHETPNSIAYLGHSDGFDDRARLSSIAAIWSLEPQAISNVTGVTGLASRRIFELSAGQRRKIDIIRLFASKRRIWLLDEPYASLDTIARDQLTARITGHVTSGGAAIIVSHGDLPDFARPVRIIDLSSAT